LPATIIPVYPCKSTTALWPYQSGSIHACRGVTRVRQDELEDAHGVSS
jgi:hypothetical protein